MHERDGHGVDLMDAKTSNKVLRLFGKIDRKILALKKKSGLKCPRCVGRCCLSDFVEVTPLDLLPIIFHLIKHGKIDQLLAKLENNPKTCVFYSKRQTEIKNCHCKIYPLRPTTCRIFGFGTVRDKYGLLKLSTCRLQKRRFKSTIAKIQNNKTLIRAAPNFSDISMRIYDIDPLWGSKRFHINEALKIVIDKIMLKKNLISK